MKVLITGANGMVARASAAYCRSVGDEVIALTRQQMDIGDALAVSETVSAILPDALINCAAYTDVDGAEANHASAYKANAEGVENLARVCADSGSVFVTISTDYVFDGAKDGFYTPDDEPNPQGVYAKSKLEGERLATAANPGAIIVRSGWIYGRHGTNFLSVIHKLLAAGKSVKAISDSFGTPTYAADLALALRTIATSGTKGTFHLTNTGEGTSYLGFAEKVCELGGFDQNLIQSVSDSDMKRPAQRPKNSRLSTGPIHAALTQMPDWKDALKSFLYLERK